MNTQLGNFTLHFAPAGKLRQLAVHGVLLLHEGIHQLAIDAAKSFTVAGWDECLPSIEALDDVPVMGLLISAPPQTAIEDAAVTQTWSLPGWTAKRRFEAGATPNELRMRFEAQNISPRPARFLWASHALFSLENVTAIAFPQQTLTELRLDNTSSKSFLPNLGPAQILRPNLIITLTTDQPSWGIWLNKGGWPASAPAGFRCIGLEPTTTNADRPGDLVLHPGQTFRGTLSITAQAVA